MNNFIAVETRLNNAISKIETRLLNLSLLPFDDQVKHPDFNNWNNLHDLNYRLRDRLWDNWSASKDAHWDKHGFNAY